MNQKVMEKSRISAEEAKQVDMADFLSRHYGMNFTWSGNQLVSISPFKEEKTASFFVSKKEGHWLFNDFSSNHGGSLIDFVMEKEGIREVSEALKHIGQLILGSEVALSESHMVAAKEEKGCGIERGIGKGYDVNSVYTRLLKNDAGVCREYLLGRGINEEVIDRLFDRKIVLHNRYKGISWCCFAVFNKARELRCLDNHEIGGGGKFVLGKKEVFSLELDKLGESEEVFVTEGIIDYLSIKSLEGINYAGLALLGNVVNFSEELFGSAQVIVSALDGDAGGFSAYLDLEERFKNKVIRVYDFGESKDANEYLRKIKSGKGKEVKQLSGGDKLRLYQEFQRSENKLELAQKWGINRSHMYELVNECEDFILGGFSQRRRGRKRMDKPSTLEEALGQLEKLKEEKRRLEKEKELYYVRTEFLKVKLKWSESEAAALRGEEVESKKKHKKKTKRKK